MCCIVVCVLTFTHMYDDFNYSDSLHTFVVIMVVVGVMVMVVEVVMMMVVMVVNLPSN